MPPSSTGGDPIVLATFADEILPCSSFFFASCLAKELLDLEPRASHKRFANNIFEAFFPKGSKTMQPEICLTHAVSQALQHALQELSLQAVASHQPFTGTLSVNEQLDNRKHTSADISITHNEWQGSILVGEGKTQLSSFSKIRDQISMEVHHLRLTEAAKLNRPKKPSMMPILLMGFGSDHVDFKVVVPTHRTDLLARGLAKTSKSKGRPDDVVFRLVEVGQLPAAEFLFREMYARAIAVVVRWVDLVNANEAVFKPLADGKERIVHKIPHKVALGMEHCTKLELGIATSKPAEAFYGGPYVSVLKDTAGGECWVFKEYQNKYGHARVTPSPELLAVLRNVRSWFYATWEVLDCADLHSGTSILRYRFVQGDHSPPNLAVWIRLLAIVEALHANDLVHCDILPQNMIFTSTDGLLIDFDLARKAGEGTYPDNFNHDSFRERHPKAKCGGEAAKEHDLHSLLYLTKKYFKIRIRDDIHSVGDLIEALQVEDTDKRSSTKVAVHSDEGTQSDK